jgi:hypothetical protein
MSFSRAFQLDLFLPLQPEGAGDLALAHFFLRVGDEIQHLLLGSPCGRAC